MKYIKYLSIIIMPVLIINILLIVLSYFNIYKYNLEATSVIITLISCFFGGYYIGKESKNKAFLEGGKIGLIVALLYLIIRLIFVKNLNIYRIIYYLLIITITIVGSILGINKKIKAK